MRWRNSVSVRAIASIVSLALSFSLRRPPRVSAAFLPRRFGSRRRSPRASNFRIGLSSVSQTRLWTSNDTPDDLLKWERMYAEGEARSMSLQDSDNNVRIIETELSEVRVVTFDLDNTLWNTSATISAANDALYAFLDEQDVVQPKRVEVVMGEIFKASKERYCPIEKHEAKSPVLLTDLRKDAIRKILLEHNNYTSAEADKVAEDAFQRWTQARHDAIPSNLASSVTTCLDAIASMRTSNDVPVIIGAITDGNSDPSLIEMLSPYFEFCINAEQVGISKPDKRVYLEAVSAALSHPSLGHVTVDRDKPVEDAIGPWWIHVGDDFVKDIVAAKGLGMRSIWSRELVKKPKAGKERGETDDSGPSQNVEEFVKRVSEQKVVRMQVGTKDYLTDSFEQEFADATVDNFGDLYRILESWQEAAVASTKSGGALLEEDAWSSDPIVSPESEATDSEKRPSLKDDGSKFCVFCGEKLPSVANFCSACGQKLVMM